MSSSRYVPPPRRRALARAKAERDRRPQESRHPDDNEFDEPRRDNSRRRPNLQFFNNNANSNDRPSSRRFDFSPERNDREIRRERNTGRFARGTDPSFDRSAPRGRGRQRDNRFDSDPPHSRRRDFSNDRPSFHRERDTAPPRVLPVRNESARFSNPSLQDSRRDNPRRSRPNDRENNGRPGQRPRPQFGRNDGRFDERPPNGRLDRRPRQDVAREHVDPRPSEAERAQPEKISRSSHPEEIQQDSPNQSSPHQPANGKPEGAIDSTPSTPPVSGEASVPAEDESIEPSTAGEQSEETPKKMTRKQMLARRKRGGIVLVNKKKKLAKARAVEAEKLAAEKAAKEKAKKAVLSESSSNTPSLVSYAGIIKPQRRKHSPHSSAQGSPALPPQKAPGNRMSPRQQGGRMSKSNGAPPVGRQDIRNGRDIPGLQLPRSSRTQDIRFKPTTKKPVENPFVSAEDSVSHVRHVKNFKPASNLRITEDEVERFKQQLVGHGINMLDVLVLDTKLFVAFERPSAAMAAQNALEAHGIILVFVSRADSVAVRDSVAAPQRQSTHSGVARRLLSNAMGPGNVKRLNQQERTDEEASLRQKKVQRRVERLERNRDDGW